MSNAHQHETRQPNMTWLALPSGHAAAPPRSSSESLAIAPDEIVWKAFPVGRGPETAIIYGDPTKSGPYVLRAKFPAGLKLMPHFHPDEWRSAITSMIVAVSTIPNR